MSLTRIVYKSYDSSILNELINQQYVYYKYNVYIYIIYILYWHLFVFEKNQFRTIIRTPKLRSQHFRSSTSKGPQPPVERTALESPFAEKDGPGGGSFNLLDFEPKNGKSLSPLSEK